MSARVPARQHRPPPTLPGQDGARLLTRARAQRAGMALQADGASTVATAPPIVHDALRSRGRPLDTAARAYLEPRFGHDFGQVRIHTGAGAAEAARAVRARAFTVGRDIVFGAGRYAPETAAGRRLLAHELAHVVQQGRQAQSANPRLARDADPAAPAPAPTPTPTSAPAAGPARPPATLKWTWKDLAAYPLLVDIWKDVILKELTEEERKAFALTGAESAAFFAWASAIGLALGGTGGEQGLSATLTYLDALGPLTPSKSVVLDGLSRLAGLRLDAYFASDLFMSRLKSHAASVAALLLVAQGVVSATAGSEPSEPRGELTETAGSRHFALLKGLVGLILTDQLKAPDFFDVGPLQMKTHPAFAAAPFAGGAPPAGLTAETSAGIGGPGGATAVGFALNLPKVLSLALSDRPRAEELDDLHKYWQTSLWFSYDRLDPTATLAGAGKLPYEQIKGGALFGTKGYLGLLEGGARLDGTQAREVTSWFLKGGFGYSGPQGAPVKRLGFTATYVDWKETDILAPGRAAGAPAAGHAARLTPFTNLEFGTRHKFGVGAALSFVTGSGESFDLSDLRGDLSYTYLGDSAPGGLPAFKIDLSGSLHRLDWWDPNSPLLWGLQLKGNWGPRFLGAQIMGGAGAIPEGRAGLLGESNEPNTVRVPTGLLITGGYTF